jgi:hypothetical protein
MGGFIKYIETSALFGEGVKNVFDEMIHTILKDQSRYQKDILGGLSNSKDKSKKGGSSAAPSEGEKKCVIM